MSSVKDCLREVRVAAAEHLEACHGGGNGGTDAAARPLPRGEALAAVATAAIRLLEQELLTDGTDEDHELRAHLKACRRALRTHRTYSGSRHVDDGVQDRKRRRPSEKEEEEERPTSAVVAASPISGSRASGSATAATPVELGQYASADAFGQNEQKRMKFARLMGGAKAAAAAAAGETGGRAHHHNTLAASTAEVTRMNANLESQFESAMSHKGKKGLGA
ncbi:Small acidic protein family [Novymonas esmeraldas]|uniref:Small acidic protein n=1 Tax=Novymonas esmeraldas TaxID=1808958 RepID=A0AAW0EUI6_9TRYP